jgi:3-deoxy-7-phosphoheptulonate synthase
MRGTPANAKAEKGAGEVREREAARPFVSTKEDASEHQRHIEIQPFGGGDSAPAGLVSPVPQRSGAQVGGAWTDQFADSPDVLKTTPDQQTIVWAGDVAIGGGEFVTMAGPCSVETERQIMETAEHAAKCGARILRGGAFKPRSSPYAFQGLGLDGLKLLAQARTATGLAVVTEVMAAADAAQVAEYADILQIGSRSMENTSLLEAAARSGRPLLLKRGMVATIADFLNAAQVVLENGNPQVILCERGIRTFETAMRNTFDAATIALLKQISHLPVIADPSHASGCHELVPALARIAVAAGADGLLVEVHPHPDKAWSDGEQSLDFAEFDEMMASLEPYLRLRSPGLGEPTGERLVEAFG